MKRNTSLFLCGIALLISCATFAQVRVQTNANGLKYAGVLVNGATAGKYNIVFVGDGFTSSATDQAKFNKAVADAVDAMRNEPPYAQQLCSFNIWRVNVISTEAGIDHPLSSINKNTELDCTFGDNVSQPERTIYSTDEAKVFEAANYAPKHDAVYVLVNDTEYGGASGSVVYTSLESSMKQVVVHELGHFVGRLADEYTCRFCDGRVEPAYSGPELTAVNVTTQTNRSLIKWNNLINAATPVPTTVDNPAGVVGRRHLDAERQAVRPAGAMDREPRQCGDPAQRGTPDCRPLAQPGGRMERVRHTTAECAWGCSPDQRDR